MTVNMHMVWIMTEHFKSDANTNADRYRAGTDRNCSSAEC